MKTRSSTNVPDAQDNFEYDSDGDFPPLTTAQAVESPQKKRRAKLPPMPKKKKSPSAPAKKPTGRRAPPPVIASSSKDFSQGTPIPPVGRSEDPPVVPQPKNTRRGKSVPPKPKNWRISQAPVFDEEGYQSVTKRNKPVRRRIRVISSSSEEEEQPDIVIDDS